MWPDLDGIALRLGDETASYGELALLGVVAGRLGRARAVTEASIRRQTSHEVGREDVRAAAVAFRQQRRLQSGEDLRAWLGERRLTVSDWEDYLRRTLTREGPDAGQLPGEPAGLTAPAPVTGTEVALAVDLACDGWWAEVADLMVRCWSATRLLGAWDGGGETPAATHASPEGARSASLEDVTETSAIADLAFLGDLDPQWCAERLRILSARRHALELVSERFAEESLVAARVRDHAADWLRLTFDEIHLPHRAAGNEAVLCARDDGLSAHEIARRAGSELQHRDLRRHAISPDVAAALLGAVPGTALGPVEEREGVAVLWLRDRRPASTADPEVRSEAAAELLAEALERVSAGRVTQVGPL